jgi:hypothetical protein
VALSPLFPFLAGGAARVLGDTVWAGRIVAAVASGLLVVPCWFVFRRLAEERVARLAAVFVVVLPSLAPFVVPYWIGWDLWVGAEPLLHLFLFSGVALFLRAWETRDVASAAACGGAFALAYLARPEAVGVFAITGALAAGLSVLPGLRKDAEQARPGARPLGFAVCALAFVVVAGPYWVYLHGTLDRWTLTGRWVEVAPALAAPPRAASEGGNRVEDMLWGGDDSEYVRALYSLDASGTRLANGYWGVPDPATAAPPAPPTPAAPAPAATPAEESPTVVLERTESETAAAGRPAQTGAAASSWLWRYAAALGIVVPWYLWLFVLPGLLAPLKGRRFDLELLVAVPLGVASILIVRIVAVDPRTQLFIAPLVAFYAARGVLLVSDLVARRSSAQVRDGLVPKALAGGLALALLATSLIRLTLSLTVGSPHHVVAGENAATGRAIARTAPEDATVMSHHPALALWADRDWRVLPAEPLDRIVTYARTQPQPYLVLSIFHPPELRPLEEPHYLIVPVPTDLPDGEGWRVQVGGEGVVYEFGTLVPGS